SPLLSASAADPSRPHIAPGGVVRVDGLAVRAMGGNALVGPTLAIDARSSVGAVLLPVPRRPERRLARFRLWGVLGERPARAPRFGARGELGGGSPEVPRGLRLEGARAGARARGGPGGAGEPAAVLEVIRCRVEGCPACRAGEGE